ncbi:MAG: hypothetical protein ACPGTP_00510 [Bacteroidia bacterium]
MGKMIGFVEGADVFLIIALLIFLGVFISAAMYMFLMTKEQVAELANLPLETTKQEQNEKQN